MYMYSFWAGILFEGKGNKEIVFITPIPFFLFPYFHGNVEGEKAHFRAVNTCRLSGVHPSPEERNIMNYNMYR